MFFSSKDLGLKIYTENELATLSNQANLGTDKVKLNKLLKKRLEEENKIELGILREQLNTLDFEIKNLKFDLNHYEERYEKMSIQDKEKYDYKILKLKKEILEKENEMEYIEKEIVLLKKL